MKPLLNTSLALLVATSVSAYAVTAPDAYELVEKGRYIATLGDCTACHTLPGKPLFSGGVAIETPFGELLGANITPDPATGIGRWTFEDFQNTMARGHGRNGKQLYPAMPYAAYTKVTREDNLALWAYLRTVQPAQNEVETNQLPFPFNVRLSMKAWNWLNFTEGEFEPDADKSEQWNRGAYLVQGLGHCGSCHTPKNLIGGDKSDGSLKGGELQGWMAPNISNTAHVGLGEWTEDDIVQYLKTGANRYDIASGPMAEAVENSTQYWRDEDLRAVAVYLKDLDHEHEKPEPLDPNDPIMTAGRGLYEDRCSACHTPDGEGIPTLFPKLANAPLVNARDAVSMIRVVLAGNRAGSTDAAPTGPAMPSFAWNLSDENIADVLTYVRNSWGNAAPAVSADEVRKQREAL
ncbi:MULTISPECIES: cytochrome c [Stutzerimonas]|uniref:Cytochrome c n=1 Tax=Stutzerimonas xanthomarina TaxID=271420 RepID=A0A3R8U7F4_9GAMM|nr:MULTISPECIES: cytochrome c [Stutzerimonas]MCQ2042410.1 cytochrome c [Stutzerimonas kunmingensis]RRV13284.1 cytochrome c [Stutzerimonas xanthomarina]SFJ59277.1 Cytochrome c, mono-and diheme variants [Stutzerimonas kunmingensis]